MRRYRINEAKVTDPYLAQKIMEFADLSDQIDRIENELTQKKLRKKELEIDILPIMEELKKTDDRTLEVYNIIITIKKIGGFRIDFKYKKAFEWLLERVNQQMKNIVLAALEETSTKSYVSSSLGVQKKKIDEEQISNLERIRIANEKIKRLILNNQDIIEGVKKDIENYQYELQYQEVEEPMLEKRKVDLNEFKNVVRRIIQEEKNNLQKSKKIRITESELRHEVRKMLREYRK